MDRTMSLCAVAVALALASGAGCLDAASPAAPSEAATASPLIDRMRARIRFFSDDTYATVVGRYNYSCFGAPDVSGDTTTGYAIGWAETCDDAVTYGIYQCFADGCYCDPAYAECLYW
jgi:hypothetical protein